MIPFSTLKHFGIDNLDVKRDIITIGGVKYHGDLFRSLSAALPVGSILRIVSRKDGVIMFERCDSGCFT